MSYVQKFNNFFNNNQEKYIFNPESKKALLISNRNKNKLETLFKTYKGKLQFVEIAPKREEKRQQKIQEEKERKKEESYLMRENQLIENRKAELQAIPKLNKDKIIIRKINKVLKNDVNQKKSLKLLESMYNYKKQFIVTQKQLYGNKIVNNNIKINDILSNHLRLNSKNKTLISGALKHKIDKLVQQQKQALGHNNVGYRVKINFENVQGTFKKNVVLSTRDGNLNLRDWNNEIERLINKNQGQSGNTMNVVSFDTVIYDNGEEGGCDKREHSKCNKDLYFNQEKYTLKFKSLTSKNNNCLIACFLKVLELNGKKFPDTIRKELKIELGTAIKYTDIHLFADYFNCGFTLVNFNNVKIIDDYHTERDIVVDLMLMMEHYFLVMETITYKRCETCLKKLRSENTDHVCNEKNINYVENKLLKSGKYVANIKKEKKEDYNLDSVIVFDFETYTDNNKKLRPYAVGWKNLNKDNLQIAYSEGDGEFENSPTLRSEEVFFNYLLNDVDEDSVISAYNGSNFDFFLIVELLNKYEVDIDSLILNNGSVLQFKFTNKKGKIIKTFDLCKFLMSSLKDACNDFKTNFSKTDFDHTKMINWEAIKENKNECVEYLKLDVLSLDELTVKSYETIYEKFRVHIFDYLTTSHMTYSLWTSGLKENISLPKNWDDYLFIRSSIFGGRTYPLQKTYESKFYEEVVSVNQSNMSKEDKKIMTQKIYNEALTTGDYIFNADVSSLYILLQCVTIYTL